MDDDERRRARAGQADEDRRVILARRQRFIALALAGLGGASSACAGGREPASESPGPANTADDGAEDPPASEGVDPIDKPPPRPPKELDPPRRKWTRPQPCLRIDLPDDQAP